MTVDINRAIELLGLFNEQAEVLKTSRFSQEIFGKEIQVHIQMKREEDGTGIMMAQLDGPDDETLKAFALTYRFFVQDNEDISIRNVFKLYESLPIDDDYRQKYQTVRTEIRKLFDTETCLNEDGKRLTSKDIYIAFLYGTLAHLTHRKTWKRWMAIPPFGLVAKFDVLGTFANMVNAVAYIQVLNREVLAILHELPAS